MRILVYGDSNSWGYLADGLGIRHPRRWPVVMAQEMGADLVEDCLPGRTAAFDAPFMDGADATGAPWNGAKHFEASLLAAAPIDLALIMLGTNDMKTPFAPTAAKIADGIGALVELAQSVRAGPGPWKEGAPTKVAVISPPPLGEVAQDPEWERFCEWEHGVQAARDLFAALKTRLSVPVFDAGTVVKGSPRDPIHYEPEDHEALGRAVASWLAKDVI